MLMEAGRKMELTTVMTGLALQVREEGDLGTLSSSCQNQTRTNPTGHVLGLRPST